MVIPYTLPSELRAAPLGIDWLSIPNIKASPAAQYAALLDICQGATDACEAYIFMPARATLEVEMLDTPNYRAVIMANQCMRVQTRHWPVSSVLGAMITPSAGFPRQWHAIPTVNMSVVEPITRFVGESSLGPSLAGNINEIDIAPGYGDWSQGRIGYQIQVAYIAGWPHCGMLPTAVVQATFVASSADVTVSDTASLVVGAGVSGTGVPDGTTIVSLTSSSVTLSQAVTWSGTDYLRQGVAPGATSLLVDDVTALESTSPLVREGAWSESVRVNSAAATAPVSILNDTVTANVGPGEVTLVNPTLYPHAPATCIISALPANVRWASYYYAAAEALSRGATAITAQALPGSLTGSGGGAKGLAGSFIAQAEQRLSPLRRVI
jgi:hypothetical protein